MRLKIVTPIAPCLDETVASVVAEAPNGSFGLLPRHVDFVSPLVPGVLVYETAAGAEHYVGINAGTLVKCGAEVLVSTRNAIPGDDLDSLQARVRAEFVELDEEERQARSALARLEAGIVRRFLELEKT